METRMISCYLCGNADGNANDLMLFLSGNANGNANDFIPIVISLRMVPSFFAHGARI